MAGVSYMAPWWVNLLHQLPHFSLRWEPTSSQFRPEDPDYQQALLLLLGAGPPLACLALDLLFLLLYSWLCCRRRGSKEHLDADCCCTAWFVVIAKLVCSASIAVGFCGNGETSDSVHRATYSLRHANHTVAGGAGPRVGHRGRPEPHCGAVMPRWSAGPSSRQSPDQAGIRDRRAGLLVAVAREPPSS